MPHGVIPIVVIENRKSYLAADSSECGLLFQLKILLALFVVIRKSRNLLAEILLYNQEAVISFSS